MSTDPMFRLKFDERTAKFVKKMMKLARSIGEDNTSCYSRKYGSVITDQQYRVVGIGYNGPPRGTPHCDEAEYLSTFFWPQLKTVERDMLGNDCESFVEQHSGKRVCPRKLLQTGPGERATLCSCQHAERNAITNSTCDLSDKIMFNWCCAPCIGCAGAIINAGIVEVHCLVASDYEPTARWLLRKGGVKLFEYKEEVFCS